MVYIDTNGNICQDRPKAAPQPGQPRSRVATVHGTPAPAPARGAARGGTGGNGGGGGAGNPLLALGEALGIDDKYVDVPAIDALKCPATRQPAVYALALGVATMVVGWRMLVAGAVFYVLTVRQ
jgi:hypothetical protein